MGGSGETVRILLMYNLTLLISILEETKIILWDLGVDISLVDIRMSAYRWMNISPPDRKRIMLQLNIEILIGNTLLVKNVMMILMLLNDNIHTIVD